MEVHSRSLETKTIRLKPSLLSSLPKERERGNTCRSQKIIMTRVCLCDMLTKTLNAFFVKHKIICIIKLLVTATYIYKSNDAKLKYDSTAQIKNNLYQLIVGNLGRVQRWF